jgi:NhaP-type Na+/H+ or K+/H+ antiporter
MLAGLAAVIVMGIGGQWVASRLRVPALLLLLMAGAVVGPWAQVWVGHKWLDPDQLLGRGLPAVISLSVAMILFEGGLTLKVSELVHVGRVVRNLVTVGAAVTFVVTALAAMVCLRLEWRLAGLLAAVLVVTGPTVIGPLLRHVRPVGPVAPILKWEGIVIDPIGAILAVLVLDAVVASHGVKAAAATVVVTVAKTAAVGVGIGMLAAVVLVVLLWRFWVADHLQNPFTLALVLATYVGAELLQADSGLLAVTVMGIAAANQRLTSVEHIREFKESLSVLLVSSLFILLSARVDAAQLRQLGWGTVLFVAVMIAVGRPAAVWASTIGSRLTWREKTFLAGMAPRGIVAAAVSSVFAQRLRQAGYPEADRLVPVTFAVIVVTVTVYGLAAVPLGRALGVATGTGGGFLIVGANPLARVIGEALRSAGQQVLMVDTNPRHLAAARMAGFDTVLHSAVGDRVVDRVEGTGIGTLLALTPNEEVNALAAVHFARVFGRSSVFQLAQTDGGSVTHAGTGPPRDRRRWRRSRELPGRVLFAPDADFQSLSRRVADGRVRRTQLTATFGMDEFRAQNGPSTVPLFVVDVAGGVTIVTADSPPAPQAGQTLVSLVSDTVAPAEFPNTVPAPVGAA